MSDTEQQPAERKRPKVEISTFDRVRSGFGCLVLVALMTLGSCMLLAYELFLDEDELTKDERRAEKYIDGPTPDTIQAAVKPLRENNVYVDPLLEQVAAAGLNDPDSDVVERIHEAEMPVYVAQLPINDDDGSGGTLPLAVEQLAEAVDRKGVYILVDDTNEYFDSTVRGEYPPVLTGSTVEDALDDLDSEYEQFKEDRGVAAQIRNGVFIGIGISVIPAGVVYVVWRLTRRRAHSAGGFE